MSVVLFRYTISGMAEDHLCGRIIGAGTVQHGRAGVAGLMRRVLHVELIHDLLPQLFPESGVGIFPTGRRLTYIRVIGIH